MANRVETPPPAPVLHAPALDVSDSKLLYGDEKHDEKRGSVEIAEPFEEGDVYDDLRAIDMGEDGKERPI
ncbi:hypothetical protein H0H93_005697, partial [Arthromyces matolae]